MAVLRFQNVYFSRGTQEILHDLDWAVQPRQIAAVLGANGCGKSTLLRLATGYLWPQRGTVQLFGATLGEVAVAPLRQRVGIVEANTVYPFDKSMTALDMVVSGYFSTLTIGYVHPTEMQWAHAREMLAHVGLSDRAVQLHATLSTGQRMRALIARALVRKPELLLLDEPTAGLDLPGREAVLATLARLQELADSPAIVIVTHHLEELLPRTASVLLLSLSGHVVASGAPDAVLTDANLSAAYGVSIHVDERNGRFHAHVDPRAWEDMV